MFNKPASQSNAQQAQRNHAVSPASRTNKADFMAKANMFNKPAHRAMLNRHSEIMLLVLLRVQIKLISWQRQICSTNQLHRAMLNRHSEIMLLVLLRVQIKLISWQRQICSTNQLHRAMLNRHSEIMLLVLLRVQIKLISWQRQICSTNQLTEQCSTGTAKSCC